jgi:hypothetical protein
VLPRTDPNVRLLGFRRAVMGKTGERSYCIIGEWADMDALANAGPQMIARLDSSAIRWRI